MYKGNSSSHSSSRGPSRGPSRGGFSHIAGRSSGFKGGAPRPAGAHPGGFSARPSGFASRSGAPSHAGHGGFHARPSTSRGGFRSGARSGGFKGGSRGGGGRGGGFSEYMNPAKFINKVAITETVEIFKPEHAFSDFAIDDRLKQSIIKKGYTSPTPIQDRTIPHILKGSDLVGVANTGTGKTAAFLIPLIHKVLLQPKEQIMIIVPTRELALQIDQEFKGFSFGMKMFSVCCVGGMSIGRQISSLKYHNSFIIGTPGRLKDLINRKMIKPANFRTIVLDEADRMLDMGFVADMRMIMALMPKDRQTLFFSATLSSEIEKLIGEFLKEPVRISVKTQDTSKNVEQDVVRVTHAGACQPHLRHSSWHWLAEQQIYGG